MRHLLALAVIASLATSLHAETRLPYPRQPCPRGSDSPVLMRFEPLPVRPADAAGRGELSAWTPMAGAWEGTGTDAGGAFTIKAGLESLFDGRFILVRTTETRGDQTVRDQLTVFTGGDAAGAFVYDSKLPFRKLAGAVDTAGVQLAAGDAAFRVTWKRAEDGLSGTREEADANGALAVTSTWSLKRTALASVIEARRRGVEGPVADMKGTLKGDGESAVTVGSAIGAHFSAEEEGVVALDGGIVITRQTHTYANGKVKQAVLIHGVENDKPFRHGFLSDGAALQFTGVFVDVGQMTFSTPIPDGTLKATFIHT
jgi:hypothetical protein